MQFGCVCYFYCKHTNIAKVVLATAEKNLINNHIRAKTWASHYGLLFLTRDMSKWHCQCTLSLKNRAAGIFEELWFDYEFLTRLPLNILTSIICRWQSPFSCHIIRQQFLFKVCRRIMQNLELQYFEHIRKHTQI